MLAMSAKLLRSCSAYSSVSGSCHARSSARTPAAISSFASASSLLMHAGVVRAQRHDAGTGERGDVHDGRGLEAARVVEGVAQHQAAFGIGVQDLDRLARRRS